MAKTVASLALCALACASTDEASLLQSRKATQMITQNWMGGVAAPRLFTSPPSTCVVSGDPHIKPFDSDDQSEMCLGPMADYYLVKTDELWIQARYTGYKRNDGYAFVKGLVIGGSRLGKKLTIPVENAGPVTLGTTVLEEWGRLSGAGYFIEHAPGPTVATYVEKPGINSKTSKNSIWIRLQDANEYDDVIIVVNQGHMQNILIAGGKANFGNSTGQCGNINDINDDTIDVDECVGKVPCDECVFGAACPNPECDKPRQPECCEGRELMFYRNICDAAWPKAERKSEWTVWNCLTDCCADRENCPDQDNEGEKGSCIIRGDPHLKTFDSGTLDKHVFGPLGDYWLVNNQFFKIQGRYGSNRADKKASLQGVFVSGAMMGGMKMYIGRDTIQINGQNIYTPLDNEHFNITDHMGENIRYRMDPVKDKPLKPVITVFFKGLNNEVVATLKVNKDINAEVNRNQAMYFQAENWLLKGVTGQCGNYNGDKSDDDGVKVDYLREGSMFTSRNPQNGVTVTAGKCEKPARKLAYQCCRKVHQGAARTTLRNCVLDNCGSSNPAESCMALDSA